MITPPVCLAVMAAASIAKSDMWKSGWEAVKLGFVAFIVPFMFVLSPSLIFQGSIWLILMNAGTATFGVIGLAVALRGFLFSRLNLMSRVVLILAAFSLIIPTRIFSFALTMNLVGLALVLIILFGNRLRPGIPLR